MIADTGLHVTIECKVIDQKVPCKFTIVNHGNANVNILKWDTPLEGILSDFMTVTRDDIKVQYDGIHIHRTTPTMSDYHYLSLSQSLSVTVDISTAYSFKESGYYSIQYTGPLVYKTVPAIPGLPSMTSTSTDDTVYASTAIDLFGGGVSHQTVGEMMREHSKDSIIVSGKRKKLINPKFCGRSSQSQRHTTLLIHKTIYTYLNSAIQDVDKDKPHYKRWFGARTPNRVSRVRKAFKDIKAFLVTKQFTYWYNGRHCRPRVLAYTWQGSRHIVLCPLQYRLPHIIHAYSQLNTLLHEQTHAVAYTDDLGYGVRRALRLARLYPNKAINNAANYAYYFITTNPIEYGFESIGSYKGVTIMTKGPVYLRYSDNNAAKLDCNFPKLIMGNWGNIPSNFENGFDAILTHNKGIYISRGNKYLKYTSLDDQSPTSGNLKAISGNAPSSFRQRLDSADQLMDNKTYVTRGSQYVCYSNFPSSFVVDNGFPKALDGNFGNLPDNTFAKGFDAMAVLPNKKTYVFKKGKYIRYQGNTPTHVDNGYPRPIKGNFGQIHVCRRH